MPVEIRELVLRARVVDADRPETQPGEADLEALRKELLSAVDRRIGQALRRRSERSA